MSPHHWWALQSTRSLVSGNRTAEPDDSRLDNPAPSAGRQLGGDRSPSCSERAQSGRRRAPSDQERGAADRTRAAPSRRRPLPSESRARLGEVRAAQSRRLPLTSRSRGRTSRRNSWDDTRIASSNTRTTRPTGRCAWPSRLVRPVRSWLREAGSEAFLADLAAGRDRSASSPYRPASSVADLMMVSAESGARRHSASVECDHLQESWFQSAVGADEYAVQPFASPSRQFLEAGGRDL